MICRGRRSSQDASSSINVNATHRKRRKMHFKRDESLLDCAGPLCTACTGGSSQGAVSIDDCIAAAEKIAHSLRFIGKGTIFISMGPSIAFTTSLLGCLAAGSIASPISPTWDASRTLHAAAAVQAVALIRRCPPTSRSEISAAATAPTVPPIKAPFPPHASVDLGAAGRVEVLRIPRQSGEESTSEDDLTARGMFRPDSAVVAAYWTSGSTGAPKAVCLNAEAVLTRLEWHAERARSGEGQVTGPVDRYAAPIRAEELAWKREHAHMLADPQEPL